MKNCPYCGNHQTSHAAHRFTGSIDLIMSPLTKRIFYGWFGKHILDPLTKTLAITVYHILKFLGLVKINKDISKVPYDRARSLWQEANRRGIDFAEIKPFGQSIDLYQAPVEGKQTFFFGLPRPRRSDESILQWIDDKFIVKQKLSDAGVPVPAGGSFYSLRQALDFHKKLGKPVVVKPRSGSRNRHTSVLIRNEEQLKAAFNIAKQLCFYVIVEEYLYGDLFRGTTINGELVGVLGIAPAKVTGNGQSTIAELIETHNQNLPTGMGAVVVTEKHIKHLMLQDLNLNSVLEKGKTVPLLEKMGTNYSGITYDCTETAHLEIKKALVDAAKIIGDPIIGFDFITEDITNPINQQNFGIIEANGAPFIQLHDDPFIGKPINTAKYVWDLVQEKN